MLPILLALLLANDEYRDLVHRYWQPSPTGNKQLTRLASASQSLLPRRLRVLSWNIWKAQGGADFQREFKLLTAGRHLVLLQEGITNENMLPLLQHRTQQSWVMANSFSYTVTGETTGVVTGSTAEPEKALAVQSPDEEPGAATPKTALITRYRLEGGEPLVVINIHGINFVANSAFKNQINQIIPVLRKYQGKAIFAGDFNTWNQGRKEFLFSTLERLGFQHLSFQDDHRWLHLDHVFVRGCEIIRSDLHDWTKGSDHSPLGLDVDC